MDSACGRAVIAPDVVACGVVNATRTMPLGALPPKVAAQGSHPETLSDDVDRRCSANNASELCRSGNRNPGPRSAREYQSRTVTYAVEC